MRRLQDGNRFPTAAPGETVHRRFVSVFLPAFAAVVNPFYTVYFCVIIIHIRLHAITILSFESFFNAILMCISK